MTARAVTGVRDDRGASSLLAVAMIGVLLLLGSALGVVAALVGAHRTAQAAADLAALAGADALSATRDPCAAAGAVAVANTASLASCDVDGRDVRVRVVVEGPRWLGQTADLEAEARAGPAS